MTLRAKLRGKAPGLTPRTVLEKFTAMRMLDVHFPTTDGREPVCTGYAQPKTARQILLENPGWRLPAQPPPKIPAKREVKMESRLFRTPA